MKKKLFVLLTTMFLFFPIFTFAKTPEIYVNGEKIVSDVDPFVKDGRLFVPLRFIGEKLGMKVDYAFDDAKGSSFVNLTDTNGEILYCSDYGISNTDGIAFCATDCFEYKGDRIFVAMRYLGNALHMDVKWDNKTKTAYFTENNNIETYPVYFRKYSDFPNKEPKVIKSSIFKVQYKDGRYRLISSKLNDVTTIDEYFYNFEPDYSFGTKKSKYKKFEVDKNNPEEIFYENNYLILNPDRTRVDGYIYFF